MTDMMLAVASKRGEKIERRLAQMGRNPNWLARQLEKPKQSVYQWIEGGMPRNDSVWDDIAAILGIERAVLLDDTRELPPAPDQVHEPPPAAYDERVRGFLRGDEAVLPVWRTVLAGAEGECAFIEPDDVEWRAIPAIFVGSDVERNVLCVAAGTSMAPRIRQGDQIVLRLDPNPPRNTLVIAESPDRQRFVKALRENSKGMQLHSLNTRFQPILDVAGWSLLGSVIAVLGPYEEPLPNIEWNYGRPLRA